MTIDLLVELPGPFKFEPPIRLPVKDLTVDAVERAEIIVESPAELLGEDTIIEFPDGFLVEDPAKLPVKLPIELIVELIVALPVELPVRDPIEDALVGNPKAEYDRNDAETKGSTVGYRANGYVVPETTMPAPKAPASLA